MRIAAISITYNDDYKFNEWVEHYQLYKDELYLHIIVDNSSNAFYLKRLEDAFTHSIIIKRKSNGGCTGAYNDGIRYALSDRSVDAIMLIGNDVKLEQGGVSRLYNTLNRNKTYGMIAPLMFAKDTNIIEDYGSDITPLMIMKPRFYKKTIKEIVNNIEVVPAVMGGMNIAKREFYEKVGLQDEKLFMYSDEVDMGLRAKKAGFEMAVTSNVYSWHQHINPVGNKTRNKYATFLGARNKVYLARKHFGILRCITVFFYLHFLFVILSAKSKFSKEFVVYYFGFVIGSFYGLVGNMKIPLKYLN